MSIVRTMKAFTIAELTLHETWRKKLLWMVFALALVFFVFFGLGFYFILDEIKTFRALRSASEVQLNLAVTAASNQGFILGMTVVNLLIVIMTILISVNAISGEIADHTIHSLASKPIRRWEIVLGKWFGNGLIAAAYIFFMMGGLSLIVYILSGYWPPNLGQVYILLILESLVILSLALFGGTLFSTLVNGAMVFMLYGVAFIGGLIEQFGATVEPVNESAIQIGIIASLVMPSQAIWRFASDLMLSPTMRFGADAFFNATIKPTPAMVIYALFYVGVVLAGTMYQFNRRDL